MIASIFAREPTVEHGGSRLRVQELTSRLRDRLQLELTEIQPPESKGAIGLARRLVAGAQGVPPRLSSHFGGSTRRTVARIADGADVVVAHAAFALPLIPRRAKGALIFDAHNLEWRVVRQLARTDPRPMRRWAYRLTTGWTRWYEARASRRAQLVWAVSELEAAWFRQIGARRVTVVRNGVTMPALLPPLPDAPTLLFVGSLGAAFNQQGVQWFLSECWGKVQREVAGARLLIVGSGGERYSDWEGVEATGFVRDLEPVYARSSVAVVPLLSGSGTRLKIAEAMAFGRPVVSTTVGAEGFETDGRACIAIEDSPAGFAAACVGLLLDRELASEQGARGREVVRALYDWDLIAAVATTSILELLE